MLLALARSTAWLFVAGAVQGAGLGAIVGTGLRFGYHGSQAEVNRLAPADRRGEVTAAFITYMYSGVVVTAVATGLISDAISLATAVAVAGIAVAAVASSTAVWHLADDG